VRVYTLGASHAIDRFGSEGATVQHVARPIHRAQLVTITLEPNGVLGRHPAAVDQLFVVMSGYGSVSGGDGARVAIRAGMAAFWSAGEEHETRADDEGLTAVVLEGEFEALDDR
jgi:quercetin dioxygenase-like cupin family protein